MIATAMPKMLAIVILMDNPKVTHRIPRSSASGEDNPKDFP